MESYVQTTSSCIGPHSTARTTDPNKFASSHFTFVLNDAEAKPKNTIVLQLPSKPTTDWETAHWLEIERGKTLATQTYERLKENVRARLHCSSCHLDAGANSTAAWWVDLGYRYATSPDLEKRINGCFERSMNGKQLCMPGPDCSKNRDMQSIIRYMEFLTRVYQRSGAQPPVPHGFPAVKTLAGDYCKGQRPTCRNVRYAINSMDKAGI